MEKSFQYEGKRIFYRSIGGGKPVMLVHGFGEDGNVWINQVEALKDKYHLLIPDLPGSGGSEMIGDMSIEGMAEVLHSIIHEENFNKCTVIGHSMGGYITLALADRYWNHLTAFGLFHSTAFPDSDDKKVTRRKGIEFIKTHGAFEFLKTTTPNLFSPDTKSENPSMISDFIESLKELSAGALIAYYEAMINRPDRTSILKNFKVPVLFIAGKHDNAVPFSDILKQCYLPEKSYFCALENSGHLGMMEEPETSNHFLAEFLHDQ